MLRSKDDLRSGVLASDAIDLKAREAEVSQFTIGETFELADGFAITAVSANLGQKICDEHRTILNEPVSAGGKCATFADLHVGVPRSEKKMKLLGRDMHYKHNSSGLIPMNCVFGMGILHMCNQR